MITAYTFNTDSKNQKTIQFKSKGELEMKILKNDGIRSHVRGNYATGILRF